MRIVEIILKVAFLLSVVIFALKFNTGLIWPVCILGTVSVLLGLTLFFNKKSSYNCPPSSREYLIRRTEAVLLILFVLFLFMILK